MTEENQNEVEIIEDIIAPVTKPEITSQSYMLTPNVLSIMCNTSDKLHDFLSKTSNYVLTISESHTIDTSSSEDIVPTCPIIEEQTSKDGEVFDFLSYLLTNIILPYYYLSSLTISLFQPFLIFLSNEYLYKSLSY